MGSVARTRIQNQIRDDGLHTEREKVKKFLTLKSSLEDLRLGLHRETNRHMRQRFVYEKLPNRVSDPHHFKPDPGTTFHLNAEPDPAFHFNVDPDPDTAPHQGDAYLRPLA